MDKKKKKILISLTAIFFIVCIAGIGTFYYYLLYPQFHPAKTVYVYVDRDDTADSIYNKVKAKGHPGNLTGFRWMNIWYCWRKRRSATIVRLVKKCNSLCSPKQ